MAIQARIERYDRTEKKMPSNDGPGAKRLAFSPRGLTFRWRQLRVSPWLVSCPSANCYLVPAPWRLLPQRPYRNGCNLEGRNSSLGYIESNILQEAKHSR